MVLGMEFFSPIQLLYINLITDSIPAIALAFEKEIPSSLFQMRFHITVIITTSL